MVNHIDNSQLVPYGNIRKTHGHKGNFVVTLENEALLELEPDFIFIEIDGIPVPFRVQEMSGTRDHLITAVSRVSSGEGAERLRGAKVYVLKSLYDEQVDLDNMEELSLYHLIGYSVIHSSGDRIGTLSAIDESTANILLILETKEREEIYVPFVEDWIIGLDHQKRLIELDCPLEILVLNEK
ncbi:ribosome maturation factor RimM [Porphyromonas cangingivalis]|uniref:ribosome maturation factor RimM n=1 Tax=Porphyromonas cangingivalis TaxID=36874 RepID=UPI00051D13A4|nr:ribosome maturation factor RimM [Porphyromonas cangingivalis]KGL49441.1 hypothetical protein HQ34_04760 [Porphyromonas cangingivalis]